MSAGHGSSDDKGDGGDGGTIYVFAGEAAGEKPSSTSGGTLSFSVALLRSQRVDPFSFSPGTAHHHRVASLRSSRRMRAS